MQRDVIINYIVFDANGAILLSNTEAAYSGKDEAVTAAEVRAAPQKHSVT